MDNLTRQQLNVDQERAVLAGLMTPDFTGNPHDPMDELRSLAETAGAICVHEVLQKRQVPEAKTYLGKGKIEEIAQAVQMHDAQVVLFENDLSPRQIANVEEVCKCKVLDRSELILDIFAARARTTEAKMQVELAQLEYTYPRLRAMWSHLERIVGGAPAGIGTRGPGEQQIEIDRRIVQRKKSELRKKITDIQARKHREVEARNKDFFTVGLVGYTNAGKSTLFNTTTAGEAYADDKLFATLSTRTRKWSLGSGDAVMLSDTVGFVRDLPHHLVASFRATLEEVVYSDLLLVVMDVAHPRCRQQFDTVMEVLDEVGAKTQPRLLVLNQIDRLHNNAELLLFEQEFPDHVAISAKTGQGIDELIERVRAASHGTMRKMEITLPAAMGRAVQFIEDRAQVLERNYEDTSIRYRLRIGTRQLDQLKAMGVHVEDVVQPAWRGR